MKKDYASESAAKRKTANHAMLIMLAFVLLFVFTITRFAIKSSSNGGFFKIMPTGDEALAVARDYVLPTVNSPNIKFTGADYRYTKSQDSVYIVKSYFEKQEQNNRTEKTNFTVRMKFNGGRPLNNKNWTLLSIEEH